jgi:hypothetical protein
MCFSAEASFTASAALVPCGVYCLTVARYRNPNYEPLALIPFFFGIQQFAEGMVSCSLRLHSGRSGFLGACIV